MMLPRFFGALAAMWCFAALPAYAGCDITPRISPHPYPGAQKVSTSNNLARPAGNVSEAPGQLITIQARLLNKDCSPIRDARIELWQRSPEGRYDYATDAELVSAPPVFTGAGTAYSRSDGAFEFITLFPGTAKKRAPYVNMRISHEDMKGVFQTRLYFAGDARNEDDRSFERLSETRKSRLSMRMHGAQKATIDIVLPKQVGRLSY